MVHKAKREKLDEEANAMRTAIMNQIVIDGIGFNKTTLMRCWDCQTVYDKKLKELDLRLGIPHEKTIEQISEQVKNSKVFNHEFAPLRLSKDYKETMKRRQ